MFSFCVFDFLFMYILRLLWKCFSKKKKRDYCGNELVIIFERAPSWIPILSFGFKFLLLWLLGCIPSKQGFIKRKRPYWFLCAITFWSSGIWILLCLLTYGSIRGSIGSVHCPWSIFCICNDISFSCFLASIIKSLVMIKDLIFIFHEIGGYLI